MQMVGEFKPAMNEPPEFEEPTTTRSIGQGPRAGRSVGEPVKTTDPDEDDVLTYSLQGPDADAFEIDAATGQIRTKDVLDSDEKDTYSVTVSRSMTASTTAYDSVQTPRMTLPST